MKVVNAAQMQSMDKTAIQELGIAGIILMENAGQQAANVILQKYPDLHTKKVSIISGKGNNGGDGLVIGRHLFNKDICVEVFLLSDRKSLSADAGINFDIAKRLGMRINEVKSIKELNNYSSKTIKSSDIIIDAVLGTGLKFEVTGLYKEVIKLINQAQKEVVSIDIPSGISSDTGKILGEHVMASTTIAFAMPKIGHVVYPSAEYSGDLRVVDIGIPKKIVIEHNIKIDLLEKKSIAAIMNKRRPNTHKGTYGHTLIIAGSHGKGGASAMASLSALRVGAGLVTLALPEEMDLALEMELPEIMTIPLPQTESGSVDITAKKILIKNLKDKEVILIGPGLSTYPSTVKLISNILQENISCPVILDADGINSIAEDTGILKDRPFPLIITPHQGEMARLLNMTPSDVQDDRVNIAKKFAQEYNVYVVLKGAGTIVATPKENIFINTTGNPGMATAGSGDVLSGIIAGLLSQGLSVADSLKAGVFLHGLAGDIAARQMCEESLIASDIIKNLSEAIKDVRM